MTMANSIELRVPLARPQNPGICGRAPSNFKVRGIETKYIAKPVPQCRKIPQKDHHRKKVGFSGSV